ncbi:hypothetical protein C8Q76DRAFT_854582 [Earliella scabrosa]|nr:hypothetical protein C8Q76DRAFT_854582 [Earliella scabrosa]
MVALSPRFSLLAVFASMAALRVMALPTPVGLSGLSVVHSPEQQAVHLPRHSDKHAAVTEAAATTDDQDSGDAGDTDDADDDGEDDSSNGKPKSSTHHAKGSGDTTAKKSPKSAPATNRQRHPKPVVPPPASMNSSKHGRKKAPSADKDSGNGVGDDSDEALMSTSEKHDKQPRDTWAVNPVTRMTSLWRGVRDVSVREVVVSDSPQLDKRRHRHDHQDKVVVKGNDNRVDVHERSLRSRSPHSDRDRVIVEGDNDHVHVHDHHNDHHEPIVVKGDDDHVHVGRSPSPRHNDSVHVHRRTPAPHRRGYHHAPAGHERVHVRRAPEPHHHHHHHHDGDHEKVIVKGNHDRVNVHRRRAPVHDAPIVISGNGGRTYAIHPQSTSGGGLLNLGVDLSPDSGFHLKRDGQIQGVPGTVDIMSQSAKTQQNQRIASLLLADPTTVDDGSSASPFILNASESGTQMYLVPLSGNATNPSETANSTTANTSTGSGFIRVSLQVAVFDAQTAQLQPYCATFNPKPTAPAPMTVESCSSESSDDDHKSQVFAYEPGTGIIRPMWYEGEDDGSSDDIPSDGAAPGNATESSGTTSAVVTATSTATSDLTSPTGDDISGATSFEQEALDEQYGSATRPASRIGFAHTFSAETLQTAQNVTLFFAPAAPEVRAPAAVNKAVLQSPASSASASASGTESATPPAATDSTTSSIPTATSSTSDSVTASDSTTSTMTETVTSATETAALSTSATDTDSLSASTMSSGIPTTTSDQPSTTSSGIPTTTSDQPSTTSSGIPTTTSDQPSTTDSTTMTSSTTDSTTMTGSSAVADITASPALEVKVYNPYASESSSESDSASSTMAATPVSSSADSSSLTSTSSSSASTMTPVSTEPYEWMFKERFFA